MKRPLRTTLPLLLVVLTGCSIGIYRWPRTTSFAGSSQRMQTVVGHAMHGIKSAVVRHPKVTNVLLIANNARGAKGPLSLGSSGGQADILMVVHIDPAEHSVRLISVPRDTLVAMPAWRVPIPKIKTVFTVGLQQSPDLGPLLQTEYVSKITGLPIHHYIVTDFVGFTNLIDSIGGIRLNVPARLYDPKFSGVDLKPGWQTLNGKQTLAFVRVRQNQAGNGYRMNDFQRQQSEMLVLKTLKNQLLDAASNPIRLMKMVEVYRKDVATNLSSRQLVELGIAAADASVKSIQLGDLSDSMNLASAPLQGVNAQNYLLGAYYDVLDPKQISARLKSIGSQGADLGLPEMPDATKIYIRLYGPMSKCTDLKQKGFHVVYCGYNWRTGASQTVVYYPPRQMAAGWAVARALGSSNAWVAPSRTNANEVVVFAT